MEKNKRNKIIGLSIGILIVLIIVVSSTYAYWQITKTQETPNDIVAACLDLNLEDKSAAIDLDSAWPISDDEASSLTGYTFTVTNNCDQEINYIVGLNRVEESNYLQDSSIKVRLDEQSSQVYGNLSDVEYIDVENTYTSRVSKQVSVETISANGTNEHTIRVWVNESAPVTEQSKIFKGQVFIIGGQGIEIPESNGCFTIADNGAIVDYDISCGIEVKVPAEINGKQVKSINSIAFSVDGNFSLIEANNVDIPIFYFRNTDNIEAKEAFIIKNLLCGGSDECPITNLSDYGPVIYGKDEMASFDWNDYLLSNSDSPLVMNITIDIDNNTAAPITLLPRQKITSIDLSNAIYLESIDDFAFNADFKSDDAILGYECTEDVGSSTEHYCTGILSELIMPVNGNLKTIGEGAFTGNKLTEVFIPNTVETIGDNAFGNYSYIEAFEGTIKKVTLEDTEVKPSHLKYLSGFGYNQLSEIKIPKTVETIGDNALAGNQLTKVVIPGSVTSIGAGAFYDNQLTEIIMVREDQTGLNISSTAFAYSAPITYDPNYTE